MRGLEEIGRFGPVPGGADHDEVFGWASGQDAFRDGGLEVPHLDRALTAMRWHRIVENRNTWDREPEALSRMVTSLAAGLWHLGGAVGIRARGGPDGLDLRFGTLAASAVAPLATVAANLPGTVAKPVSFDDWMVPAARGGLLAVIDPDADPSAPGLLDRLTALTDTVWQIDALLVPIPATEIADHAIALTHLAVHLAGERTRQVQTSPTATATVEDPVVAHLAAEVEREQERVRAARRSGAFALVVTIAGLDGVHLASAVGAATGAAPSSSTGWTFTGPLSERDVVPVAAVASTELIDVLRPPLCDVHGLPSRSWHRLDEHPEPVGVGGPTICLGRTEHGATIDIPIQLLLHHLLVTGASGSGKSSFLAKALTRLVVAGIPVWIIEPVKNEWHSLPVPGLARWAIGAPDPGLPWGLNPLEVPEGTPAASHIDLLAALFRSAFALPEPLDHLVELGLQRAYQAIGWDLGSDRYLRGTVDRDTIEWPTVSDLLRCCLALPKELGYDEHIQGNLRAALSARLGGLTRGPRGRLLDTTAPFPMAEALSGTVVINLDSIGDDHSRSFIMGLLLIRLAEHRRANPSASLEHVTVIEEAHRLMGRGGATSSTGAPGPVAGTSEMFGNLLGEIRATGEGLVIVDQSPNELVRGAIVNTGTQVALRSKDRDDQRSLGAAIGLRADQENVLASLAVHEGLVSWEGMDVPVRARLESLHLRSTPPVVGGRPRAGAPEADREVASAAAVFVRVGAAGHAVARAELLGAIERSQPHIDPGTKAEVLSDAVDREVRSLAGARRWSTSERQAATRSALGGHFDEHHPSRLLVDGRRPHLSCASVCPVGGCLVGELVQPEAQKLLAEGPASLVRLVASEDEARHRLRRRALAAVPETAPAELQGLARGCVAVQVFDDWAAPDLVAQLVTSSRTDGR